MSKTYTIFFLFFFLSSAQITEHPYVIFEFYPAFEFSSTIKIDVKKSLLSIDIEDRKRPFKIELSNEDREELKALIDSIYNDSEPPEIIFIVDGKELTVEDWTAEDGMMVIINFIKEKRKVDHGNTFSSTQSKLLIQLINYLSERADYKEYFDKLLKYLK